MNLFLEKLKPYAVPVETYNSMATMDKSVRLLKKLKMELPYDSAISLLSVHTKVIEAES